MTAAELTAALGGRWHGGYGMARCPAHGDANPSLSITDRAEGRLLVHCHARCEQQAVIAALQARGLWVAGTTAARSSWPIPGRRIPAKPATPGIPTLSP
jgi:hypothetical protein